MDQELNLLYTLFTARLGNVPPDRLAKVYEAWRQDTSKAMPARTVEAGLLSGEQSQTIVVLVKQAAQHHGGNAAAAWQHLGADAALRNALTPAAAASAATAGTPGWVWPTVGGLAAATVLSVVVLGAGWMGAASARAQLANEVDTLRMVATEVDHLRQRVSNAETARDETTAELERVRRALTIVEEDLATERRARRSAEAQGSSADLPGNQEQAAVAWQQPGQGRPRPVNMNLQQLEQQTRGLDPTTAIGQLAPQFPTDARGNIIGVSSNNFSSIPLAQQLGLQNGDIISNINGVNITGIGSYGAIANAVQGGGPVTVTIIRNGQPLTATFNIR